MIPIIVKIDGSSLIEARPTEVFDAILDAKALADCLPDIQSMEMDGTDSFRVRVKTGMSILKQNIEFLFTIRDKQYPNHARIVSHGTATGTVVDIDAQCDLLATDNDKTTVTWIAEASFSGPLATMGSMVLRGVLQKIISDIFKCIKHRVEL